MQEDVARQEAGVLEEAKRRRARHQDVAREEARVHLRGSIGAVPPATSARQHWRRSSGDICAAASGRIWRRSSGDICAAALAPFLRRHLRGSIGAVPPATSARQHWRRSSGDICAAAPGGIWRRSSGDICAATLAPFLRRHLRGSIGSICAAALAPFLRRHLRGSICAAASVDLCRSLEEAKRHRARHQDVARRRQRGP